MRVALIATMTGLLTACPKPAVPDTATKAAAQSDVAEEEPAQAAPTPPEPSQPTELSEEDQRLIAMDPDELTPELRRKRAYARRRQAMLNPDSPLARTLNDLQKASQNGEIDPLNGGMPTFTVDGKPPSGGQGPAGTRKAPAGAGAPAP